MKLTGDWIERPATQAVCRAIEQGGHQALFVGGCVRNAILGAPVHDIDIATDAHPETIMALAEGAGMKPVPTGLEHGTVTVVSDHIPHEVTTFRRDVETYGRHAVVAYSGDVAEDARRRDFTMNALYARPDGTVIDPLDGLKDLKARYVRFIDDPAQRIHEDYLRILRFFRFHAWYGDPQAGLDADGLAAVAAHLDGLSGLSRERVGAEIVKLLNAADPAPSVAAMRACGVLAIVLPGSDDKALAPLVYLEQQAGIAPEPMRRLAALGGDGVSGRLRLGKAQSKRLSLLRQEASKVMTAEELGYRHGAEMGVDVLLLRSALLEVPLDPALCDVVAESAQATLPVTPHDLMPEYSGPALGARLAELERLWIDSGFRLTRDELLAR
ncbi:CCA tRNA nucleotidyltransferase [Roseovarius sp. EGI FJ00037]|uniref:CCA tRNA nucleotidyltransferase n=1 Tax=Roseovarius salincola TaxID=2978479 RepID=UPI0022A68A21|nr:CCA tRNA nucleotidyltransferase [Roseovarius sp. EGI FJ00037]MCZ0811308.1 CCA tRNA nucleotidyltransferase [Roseovarius sp. EGI FJ00037]